MSNNPQFHYINAFFEQPSAVTQARQYFPGSVETVAITTAAHTPTVGLVLINEIRPKHLVNLTVTNQINATITLSKNFRRPGDSIEIAWTPSDLTGATTYTFADDAGTPNTLATITATSEGTRSRSSRRFVLDTTGLWISVGPVPTTGNTVSQYLIGTKTYDAASITAPNTTSTTVTVTGAAVGDYVLATLTTLTTAAQLTAYVSATNTVTVVVGAYTGTVDLASGTLNVLVIKAV